MLITALEYWNLKEKVSRQEEYIEELESLKSYYKQTAEEQRDTIDKQDEQLKQITELAESNTYGNDRAVLDKIKEVIRRQTK